MTTTPLKRALGVCYYPEHWEESQWATDAARMAALGLTWVRIGEFAWARMEPQPGKLELDWLDRAIDTLGAAGLKVVLGTPTATPPRWMLDRHPDMLAHDREGRPRGFGSRRHYDFAHEGYRAECARITEILARRYGRNPHVGITAFPIAATVRNRRASRPNLPNATARTHMSRHGRPITNMPATTRFCPIRPWR